MPLAHPFERGLHRWHDVGDGDAGDVLPAQPARTQQGVEEQSVLVGRLLAPAHHRQEASQPFAVLSADLEVGVADLDDEQHQRARLEAPTGQRGPRLAPAERGDSVRSPAHDAVAAGPVGDQQGAVGVDVDGQAAGPVDGSRLPQRSARARSESRTSVIAPRSGARRQWPRPLRSSAPSSVARSTARQPPGRGRRRAPSGDGRNARCARFTPMPATTTGAAPAISNKGWPLSPWAREASTLPIGLGHAQRSSQPVGTA